MFLIYMSRNDWLALFIVTILFLLLYYARYYYLRLQKRMRLLQAEMDVERRFRPVGWYRYLKLPASLILILGFYLYIGVVSLIVFKTFWAGLFWFLCAGMIIWIKWGKDSYKELLQIWKQKKEKSREEETELKGFEQDNDPDNIDTFYK
ncbi:membrane hypothetical protein [Candidatus Zixiibacteriota bacterium]|nr:membrane hypothetical protein [candidate division Zixibacteria bacterium]